MRYISFSEARQQLKDLFETTSERIILTHNGQPKAIVMSIEDYQAMRTLMKYYKNRLPPTEI